MLRPIEFYNNLKRVTQSIDNDYHYQCLYLFFFRQIYVNSQFNHLKSKIFIDLFIKL